jgi:hypothetical protein
MAGILTVEVTPTIAAVFIKEHYSKEAQLACRREQVLAGTMDTQYEDDMRSGAALHIPHVLNLAVTAKSDATAIVGDAQTPTNQDITVSSYYYTAVYTQSITQVQMDYDYVSLMGGQIGYALQGQIEADCAGMPDSLSDSVGTFGLELTMDDWESVWQKMQIGLAPKNDRFAWLSSEAISAIRKLGTPISADFTRTNLNALDDATLGMFLGFKIIESQYLEIPATGQHDCGVHQRQQYILIRQKSPTIERDRIIGDLSDMIVGWELYTVAERQIVQERYTSAAQGGAEALDDNWGVWLKTV